MDYRHTAKLVLARETKGAVMYEEVDSNNERTVELIGNLYIRKSALMGQRPKTIEVHIDYA